MIKIEIYSMLGKTVVTVQASDHASKLKPGEHAWWAPLSYAQSEPLAHDELAGLQEAVDTALAQAHARAAEMGGWSHLV